MFLIRIGNCVRYLRQSYYFQNDVLTMIFHNIPLIFLAYSSISLINHLYPMLSKVANIDSRWVHRMENTANLLGGWPNSCCSVSHFTPSSRELGLNFRIILVTAISPLSLFSSPCARWFMYWFQVRLNFHLFHKTHLKSQQNQENAGQNAKRGILSKRVWQQF